MAKVNKFLDEIKVFESEVAVKIEEVKAKKVDIGLKEYRELVKETISILTDKKEELSFTLESELDVPENFILSDSHRVDLLGLQKALALIEYAEDAQSLIDVAIEFKDRHILKVIEGKAKALDPEEKLKVESYLHNVVEKVDLDNAQKVLFKFDNASSVNMADFG